MRVVVDRDRCADHGQCVFAAPEVFRLGDAVELVYEAGELDDALRATGSRRRRTSTRCRRSRSRADRA